MSKLSILGACVLACASMSAHAQTPVPQAVPKVDAIDVVEIPATDAKTWYVMIAIEQALGPRGCRNWRYKVSTVEPIAVEGPAKVNPHHADEVAGWWLLYIKERSPAAYGWLTGPDGHLPPQVYFRESRQEAIEAFRADGHLRRDRSCEGSVLVTHGTSRFNFVPPYGFTSSEFGNEAVPEEATVVREVPKVRGEG